MMRGVAEAEAEVEKAEAAVKAEEEEDPQVLASSVIRKVIWLENALTLIRDQEVVEAEEAQAVLEEATASSVGSQVTSQENVPTVSKIQVTEVEVEAEEEVPVL